LVSEILAVNKTFIQQEGDQSPRDELFQQRTAIKFDVYDIENGFRSIDARKFFSMYELNSDDFTDIERLIPDEQNPDRPPRQSEYEYHSNIPNLPFQLAAEPNFRPDGLHLTVTTTQGRYIRDFSDRVLRRIEYKVRNEQCGKNLTDSSQ
jgi:hypothetical protein